MSKKSFTQNVTTEVTEHGDQYGRALKHIGIVTVVFALVQDAEIFNLSWWWLALPAARVVLLAAFITYVGFTGNRD